MVRRAVRLGPSSDPSSGPSSVPSSGPSGTVERSVWTVERSVGRSVWILRVVFSDAPVSAHRNPESETSVKKLFASLVPQNVLTPHGRHAWKVIKKYISATTVDNEALTEGIKIQLTDALKIDPANKNKPIDSSSLPPLIFGGSRLAGNWLLDDQSPLH